MESEPLPSPDRIGKLEAAARRATEFSVPQWISAFSSLVVASIAIWALLFSSTSEALVKYLHSELATRNIQIATLEAREQKLQVSVESREKELSIIEQKSSALVGDLANLTEQRDTLQRQVANIESERNRLVTRVDEIGSNLSQTEFSLVKERIRAELSGKIVSTIPFHVGHNLAQGARLKKPEVWTDYLDFIRSTANKLPEKDRTLVT
jgi:septal ring factor EnvC (AmiA/AmiB activator)